MRAVLLIGTLVAALVGLSGCFKPQLGDVAFRCGDAGDCPSGYSCGTDGCCHKDGSDPAEHGACLVWEDAAVSQDASPTADASP
jgi:hypothetical protein